MADDQVKYSDLIVDDGAIDALDKRLEDIRTQLKDLKGQAVVLGDSLKGIGSATESGRKTIRSAASETDKLSKAIRARQEAESKLAIEIARVKEKTREANAMAKYQAQLADSAAGSYKALSAQYSINKIILNSMSAEERKATEEGRKLEAETKAIYEEMKKLQEATGKHQLNVGNYADATKGLRSQIMDLTEAMVRLRMEGKENTSEYANLQKKAGELKDAFADAQQEVRNMASDTSTLDSVLGAMSATSGGFAAVTGAMQLFGAESEDVQEAQKTLQASIALVNGVTAVQNNLQHQSALMLGVSKVQTYALAKAEAYERLIKIQGTSATVGATVAQKAFNLVAKANPYVLLATALLSVVGALWAFSKVAKSVSRDMDEMRAKSIALKNVNDGAASTVGELTAKYKALQQEWRSLKAEDQGEWLNQHKNDWQELGYSIDDAKKAEDFYVNNTAAVQEAIDKRARSIAAMKIAADKYEEAFNKEVEAENAVANRSASTWNRVKQILMGFSGAKYSWTRNYLEKTIEEDAKAYAQDMRDEAKALREEATKLITTFVLPEESKPTGQKEKKGKEPKDQVADMLTLQRQLEDQIIANIENEYKRLDEEETKRHERFIQDQEAELAKLAENDPRRAVINQMIEEENRTHERKMEEIDEKRYQNLQALTQKRLADEKKAAEEEEKQEKDNAKTKLKAAVDGWAEYKARMVEEGKTRKQIVEAEVAAEIARLNLMLKLNRDINGEKMSDEQRQKVEEWIKLLEKLQQTGNYGDYKPGQFIGKGGANVTNERKNFANIWEVLGIDMDSNQTSALNSVFDQAKEALNSWMDARKAAADQAKELADDEVSAAENALNREIELRNQGYANNVALRERELADAKEKQKQAVEEQKKIAQQQILLDAALQTSSLITASANIWKQFATQPWLAAAMLATMWGSFGYAKIKAYQASTKSIQFREGGVMMLEGGSHESGHDVNLGIGPDGSNLRAEGGEYFAVINKRNSRKYGSEIPAVVNALNSGMFEDRYIKTSDAVGLLPRVIRADNGSEVDLSAVESGVGELVKQGESRWTVEGEYRVERYKNRVRRVKIS